MDVKFTLSGTRHKTFLSLLAAATRLCDVVAIELHSDAIAIRAVPQSKATHFYCVLDAALADAYTITGAAALPLTLRMSSKALAASILRNAPSMSALSGSMAGSDRDNLHVSCVPTEGAVREYTLHLCTGECERAAIDGALYCFECTAEPRTFAGLVASLGGGSQITIQPQQTRLLLRSEHALFEGPSDSLVGPVVSIDAAQFTAFSMRRDARRSASEVPGKLIDVRPAKVFFHVCDAAGLRVRLKSGGDAVPVLLEGLPKEAQSPIRHLSLLIAAIDAEGCDQGSASTASVGHGHSDDIPREASSGPASILKRRSQVRDSIGDTSGECGPQASRILSSQDMATGSGCFQGLPTAPSSAVQGSERSQSVINSSLSHATVISSTFSQRQKRQREDVPLSAPDAVLAGPSFVDGVAPSQPSSLAAQTRASLSESAPPTGDPTADTCPQPDNVIVGSTPLNPHKTPPHCTPDSEVKGSVHSQCAPPSGGDAGGVDTVRSLADFYSQFVVGSDEDLDGDEVEAFIRSSRT